MKEIRKEDVSQEVFDLYDDYAHNRLDRRQFINKLSAYPDVNHGFHNDSTPRYDKAAAELAW
ncbi:MAG: dienelactone hydrolase family protein [Bacteroidota bacterium]|nr:dienelactone hydrolase family protein [Bacteroidota bacterium]